MKIHNFHYSSRLILIAAILIAATLLLFLSSCEPNTYYRLEEERDSEVMEVVPEEYERSSSTKSIVFYSSGEQVSYKYRITDLSGKGYSSAKIGSWVELSGAYDEFSAYFSQGNWQVELALKVRNNQGQYVWTDTKTITQYINLNQGYFDFSSLFNGSTTRAIISEIKTPRVVVDLGDETLSYSISSISGSYTKIVTLTKVSSDADTITFGNLTIDSLPIDNYTVIFTLKAGETVLATEVYVLNAKYGVDATCSGTIYPNKILDAQVKISDIPTGYISEFSLMSGSLPCEYPNSSKWVWYIDGSHVDNDNRVDLDINRLSAGTWGWDFLESNYHYADCYFLDEYGQYGSCSVEIKANAEFGKKQLISSIPEQISLSKQKPFGVPGPIPLHHPL